MRSDAADGSVARAARRGQAGGTAAMSEARHGPERARLPVSSHDVWGELVTERGSSQPAPGNRRCLRIGRAEGRSHLIGCYGADEVG